MTWTEPPSGPTPAGPPDPAAVGPSPSPPADPTIRAAARIWLDLPRRASRRVRTLDGIAGDGAFLTASPLLAVAAPVACLVAGFWVGATGWGYDLVVTESVFLLTAAILLGALSSQLGLATLAGFASGEFLVGVTTWSYTVTEMGSTGLPEAAGGGVLDRGLLAGLLRVRLPMIVVYLVLAAGVLLAPRLARGLADLVRSSLELPSGQDRLVTGVAYAAVLWLAIEAWVGAVPLLIRPVFTWRGGAVADMFEFPPAQTTYGVTHFRQEIVAAAVLGAAIRYALVLVVRHHRALAATERAVAALAAPEPPPVERGAAARALRCAGAAAAGALVLAGVLETPWTWAAALLVLFVIAATYDRLLPPLPSWWRDPVGRVPRLIRVVILVVVVRLTAGALTGTGSLVDSFDSAALFIVIGAALGHLWLAPEPSDPEGQAVTRLPFALGVPLLLLGAAVGLLLILVGGADAVGACLQRCIDGGWALDNALGGTCAVCPLRNSPDLEDESGGGGDRGRDGGGRDGGSERSGRDPAPEPTLAEAKYVFHTNRDFHKYFHRYKQKMGQTVGGRRNPDLGDELMLDAYRRWLDGDHV